MQDWINGFIIGMCIGFGAGSFQHKDKPMSENDKKIVIAVVFIAIVLVLISVLAPKFLG